METYHLEPESIWNNNNTPNGFVDACSHSGNCENDIKNYLNMFTLADSDLPFMLEYIKEFGIEMEDFKSKEDIITFILWIMAGDIQENGEFILSH